MALAVLESTASRFARDVTEQSADRQSRNYEFQPTARLYRRYVHTDGTSEFDGYTFP